MEGGPKIKKNGSCSSPQTPPSGQIFTWSYSTCKCLTGIKFQLPSSNSFRDKEGVPKFNVGATTPLPYLVRWNFYVCFKCFSIVSLCVMQSCEYVFPIGFPFYVLKNWVFGGFEGEDLKILCSGPWKSPCVNTSLLVYRVSKSVNGLSSRSVERFCVQRNIKKLSGKFGYMGRSHLWGDLDQKCGMWGDMVDVITYAIFGDCRSAG